MTIGITLPEFFARKMAEEPKLKGQVIAVLSDFEPWLEQSGMPFFPGFTDHSPRHINDVLKTASSLISDDARELISAKDVAVLTLAILLHDCGMHLTTDSFHALIQDSSTPLFTQLGDRPWQILWQEFLSEASRFDETKLISIFGDADPIDTHNINTNNLNERERLLVGEFVRRHHARLAHEIALKGVPMTGNGLRLSLSGIDSDLCDIAGLIARSHGMALRDTFDYIKDRYDLKEYRKVKIIFLMGVLRIADYVQVQSERAIQSLLKIKELRSPISRQEWRAHFAVKDVTNTHDDPEALFVRAAPEDVKTYLKLNHLFKDIQRELDETWAVFGETYGRFESVGLDKLAITIRRIRSNIENVETFSKTVQYLPVEAKFDTSGPELLKLLVGPLYDYRPAIGIRELIQNSIDACRELENLNLLQKDSDVKSHAYDVEVRLIEDPKEKTRFIEISDKGVGMTLSTVTNYFLRAGASFRKSDIWKQLHLDASGKPNIVRGGRFGVGALAAFLLGNEIDVTTRHYSECSSQGLTFTTTLLDTSIELRRVTSPIGTTIKIRITDEKIWNNLAPLKHQFDKNDQGEADIIQWPEVDWYLMQRPSLSVTFQGYLRRSYLSDVNTELATGQLKSKYLPLPRGDAYDSNLWQRLPESSFDAVFWTYVHRKYKAQNHMLYMQVAPNVSVNGILVTENRNYERDLIKFPDEDNNDEEIPVRLIRPFLAILDSVGICPINLQRSRVAFENTSIDIQLGREVWKNYLAYILVYAPTHKILDKEFHVRFKQLTQHPSIHFTSRWGNAVNESPFLITKEGLTLLAPRCIADSPIRKIVVLELDDLSEEFSVDDLEEDEGLLLTSYGTGNSGMLAWFRSALSLSYGAPNFLGNYRGGWSHWLPVISSVGSVHKDLFQLAKRPGSVRKDFINGLNVIATNKSSTVITTDVNPSDKNKIKRFNYLCDKIGKTGSGRFAYWELSKDIKLPRHASKFVEIWYEVYGQYAIPFIDRQQTLSNSFSLLASFIKSYEFLEDDNEFSLP